MFTEHVSLFTVLGFTVGLSPLNQGPLRLREMTGFALSHKTLTLHDLGAGILMSGSVFCFLHASVVHPTDAEFLFLLLVWGFLIWDIPGLTHQLTAERKLSSLRIYPCGLRP